MSNNNCHTLRGAPFENIQKYRPVQPSPATTHDQTYDTGLYSLLILTVNRQLNLFHGISSLLLPPPPQGQTPHLGYVLMEAIRTT
jgi:hypothetical protein